MILRLDSVFQRNDRQGFTLIELAIVLVIIGLIIGGVLVGRELIAVAEVRKVVSGIEQIRTATNTFRLKYNCIAGDCANATQFFGIAGGNGSDSDCSDAVALNPAISGTCNGNGNGAVDYSDSINLVEPSIVLNQLGKANLIVSKLWDASEAKQMVLPITSQLEVAYAIDEDSVRGDGMFAVTKIQPDTNLYSNVFSGSQAKQIDEKTDDGLPMTGRIYSGKPTNDTLWSFSGIPSGATDDGVSCTTNDTTPVRYNNLGSNIKICSIVLPINK